jgi:hypothetical protein
MITNPTAVLFSNTQVRPMADLLGQAYYAAKQIVNNWNATGMSSLITNDSNVIVDGSATDGRNQITGAQATNIIVQAEAFISTYEAGSNAVLNDILQVAVNP